MTKLTTRPAMVKRVPDLVAENKFSLVNQWLERVTAHAELRQIPLSEPERRDHVPDMLDEAIANACGNPINVGERQKAAERHGTLRYHQGYSVPMLVSEAGLLQEVIAECIRDNVGELDVSNLISDIGKICATINKELEESLRAFMKQSEWHDNRLMKEPGPAA